MCGNFSNSQWIYGVRAFMTPQTMFAVCFSSWSMSTATHVTLKMVSQTKRTVLIIFLGGGVPPSPENPYPISDQNIRFSIPYFRPDSQNVYPISDPVMCGNFSNSQWIYGVRDFMTPQTMFAVCFSSWSMSTATHVTLKMVSQTKRTEYTPYFRPKWQILYPISDMLENGALWGGTYLAYIWEYPPSEGGGGVRWQINAACMLSYNDVIHSFC